MSNVLVMMFFGNSQNPTSSLECWNLLCRTVNTDIRLSMSIKMVRREGKEDQPEERKGRNQCRGEDGIFISPMLSPGGGYGF